MDVNKIGQMNWPNLLGPIIPSHAFVFIKLIIFLWFFL
jgi:hypothetical protein